MLTSWREREMRKTGVLCLICLTAALSSGVAHAEWVQCGVQKVWVQEPNFHDYGLKVYYAGNGQLVFWDEKTESVRFCFPVEYSSSLDGFFSFKAGKNSEEEKVVFAVSLLLRPRYIDIATGTEVYVSMTDKGTYYIDSQPYKFPGEPVNVIKQWHSHDSLIADPEYHKITSSKEWEDLWRRHQSPGVPVLSVNFRNKMIVALLCGVKINSAGIEIVDVRETQEEIDVYFRQLRVRAEGGVLSGKLAGFVLLPRSSKKVVIKEETFIGKGLPLRWKTVAVVR